MSYERALIAVNPFKGNIGTMLAGVSLTKGLRTAHPGLLTEVIPVSDGGDGLLEVIEYLYDCQRHILTASTATAEALQVPVVTANGTAYIEMAACNGLSQCKTIDFKRSSTYGVGELMAQLIARGSQHIVLGIGGSASADLGLGALQALGLQVYDKQGRPMRVSTGNLGNIGSLDVETLKRKSELADVTVTCWVDGEAFVDGEDGCWERALGKGGTEIDKHQLKADILRLIPIMEAAAGCRISGQRLMGCGGGTAAGLAAVMGATLALGSDVILDLLHIDQRIDAADVVITGEGMVDHTTFINKLPGRLLQRAARRNKPVIFVTSSSTLSFRQLREHGVTAIIRTELDNYDVTHVRTNQLGEQLLEECGENIGSLLT